MEPARKGTETVEPSEEGGSACARPGQRSIPAPCSRQMRESSATDGNGRSCAITDHPSNDGGVSRAQDRHTLELAPRSPTESRRAQTNDGYSPDAPKLYPALPFCLISCPAPPHPGFRASPYLNPNSVPLPNVPLLNSHKNTSSNNTPLTPPTIAPASPPALSPRSSDTITPGKPDEETGMVVVVGSSPVVVEAELPGAEGVAICVTVSVVVEMGRLLKDQVGVCEGIWGDGKQSEGREGHTKRPPK